MSEEKEKESRTELPTEKKQQDALAKGNAPISREVSHLAFFTMLFVVLSLSAGFFSSIAMSLRSFIERPHQFVLGNANDVAMLVHALAVELLPALGVATLPFLIAGVAATVVQTPPQIAWERIAPQMSRLSLSAGWKRIFGAHGLAELLKGIVKLGLVGIVGAVYVLSENSPIFSAVDAPVDGITQHVFSAVSSVVGYVAAAAATIAILDVLWSRHRWFIELKMTKQEVRDEHRQQEGDPAIASRRKAISRMRSRKRMLANVGRATLVVANPTHYAVAMRYVRSEGGAPIVVAKGADFIALQIRRLAEEKGIPVVEDRALARSLYEAVEVDQSIPAAFYRAVAEILIMLQRRSNGRSTRPIQGSI